jgi:hypothetical protein
MKLTSVIFSLLWALAFTAYGQQEDPLRFDAFREGVVREDPSTVMSELHRVTFADVLASGVTPLYSEALTAEDEIADPSGTLTNAHMTFVPFVNPATAKRGYYIHVAVSSIDGVPLFEHEFTVRDLKCNCMLSDAPVMNGSPPEALKFEAQSISSDAKKILSWINAKNWTAIKNWISAEGKRGVARAIINATIKKAFELAGYKCPDLPWYIPAKFLVYMLSCYRVAS